MPPDKPDVQPEQPPLYAIRQPPLHAAQALQQYSLLDRVPEQEMRRLGLENIAQGAFPIHSLSSGTSYLAASLVAQAIKTQPTLSATLGKEVKLDDLIATGSTIFYLGVAIARERLDHLAKIGVLELDNQQVPVQYVDLVLHDLASTAFGRILEYPTTVSMLSDAPSSKETALKEYGALEKTSPEIRQDIIKVSFGKAERSFHPTSVLGMYLRQVKRYPNFSHEQEQELGRKAREGSTEAATALAHSNLRFVVRKAYHYTWSGVPVLDLIQAGNMGLMRAVAGFDPERGYRFSTYAVPWIRQGIQREIMNQGRTVRLPVNVQDGLWKIRRSKAAHYQETNQEQSNSDVAKSTGLSDKAIHRMMAVNDKAAVSLDETIRDDSDETRYNLIVAGGPTPEEAVLDADIAGHVRAALAKLSRRERTILEQRFGLGAVYDDDRSLEAVGDDEGVTSERIRQIEATALRKLKKIFSKQLDNDVLSEYADRGQAPPPIDYPATIAALATHLQENLETPIDHDRLENAYRSLPLNAQRIIALRHGKEQMTFPLISRHFGYNGKGAHDPYSKAILAIRNHLFNDTQAETKVDSSWLRHALDTLFGQQGSLPREQDAADEGLLQRVREAVGALSEQQKRVLELRHQHTADEKPMTFTMIGRDTGVGRTNCSAMYFNTIKKLAQKLVAQK